jgi:homoserine dehydrogenase
MMSINNKQTIGLFGFGVVGESLYQVLRQSRTTNASIKTICIKNPGKARSLPGNCFTTQPEDILDDPEINLVVELISDADAAFDIVSRALRSGKSVVSGNKKMLAFHLEELLGLQALHGTALLYDASACGSIPVIRNLEEYYDNDLLLSITGILNGSSNFVLSRIFHEGIDYATAIEQAREKGFLEADPSMDVGGFDALYKLVILALHGFGTIVDPNKVFVRGIENLHQADIRFAREKGYRIKLVAQASKVRGGRFNCLVLPRFVTEEDYIYNVENEYNGVVINGEFYEKQFMFGKGAGGLPTGSSVLSDITARMHSYRYEYKKRKYFSIPAFTNDLMVKVYVRYQRDEELEIFGLVDMEEQLSAPNYKYAIGKACLSRLVERKEQIERFNGFLAYFDIEDS